MEQKVSSGRILYFDLLNIAAALGVVYLHCNGMVHSFQRGGELGSRTGDRMRVLLGSSGLFHAYWRHPHRVSQTI